MSKKVLVIVDVPGMSTQQFNDAWDHLKELGHHSPDGLMHHFGGENETGITVVDVWDSAEHFQAFGKILMPVLAKFGIDNIAPRVMPMHYLHKIGG
ncbi:MAG: hypothetical protein ABI723_13325 [Bacteroidia bacterium]